MQGPDVYLDHNATTPLDPLVIEAMGQALREVFGNPSSPHRFGERAAAAVEGARRQVAALLEVPPAEVVFTSGGTESINTAVDAALAGAAERGRTRVLTSAVEHPAVLRALDAWTARGVGLEMLPVDADGRVDTEDGLRRLARGGGAYALVSLQAANNETGVVTPAEELEALGSAAREAGVPFHLDAVQAPGKLALGLGRLPVDLASISAHKLHGPKGVGALVVRGAAPEPFPALLRGGPQEGGRRAGTPNVPGIVGLGVAAELARRHVEAGGSVELARRRDGLEEALLARIPGARIHGRSAPRLPNTTSVHLPGGVGDLLVPALAAAGVAVSAGAACSSGRQGPSPVLLAQGLSPEEALGSLRISLGRTTTAEEVERALGVLERTWSELAAPSPATAS